MAEPVVNASPLIYLGETGLLELLRLAADIVVVPDAVAEEVRRWARTMRPRGPWL